MIERVILNDILIILRVYLVSLGWQLLLWPWVKHYLGGLVDRGWAISRVLGSLLVSLLIWEIGNLGLATNTSLNIFLTLVLGTLMSWIGYRKWFGRLVASKESFKYMMVGEGLFILGLFLFSLIRGFEPSIRTLEKFMDFGFVNQYIVSSKLPANDMWFAGESINYYSFGHFWASVLIRSWLVRPEVGYNIMIGYIGGLGLALSFAIVASMINGKWRSKIAGGLAGSLAVMVGGNSHGLWYFIKNGFSMSNYWYADATRFIYHTIHEFPSYSLVVSDLHGHLLGLPMVLTFLAIMIDWSNSKKYFKTLIMGVLVGVMAMTNTWDVPIFMMVWGLYLSILLLKKEITIGDWLVNIAIVVVMAIITAIPWAISFKAISSGIAMVKEGSLWWQLAVLWGSGLISLLLARVVSKKQKNQNLILAMILSAVFLIIIPEIVYARDIYPDHPRANTMFKLTYQAFVLMGLMFGYAVGQWKETKKYVWQPLSLTVLLVIMMGAWIFPMESYSRYYGNFKIYIGLDGSSWITETIPERKVMIDYLKNHRDGKNMVEAVGDSYTDYNVISIFSGVPTVQGWRVHEWLWRGGYTLIGVKDEEVKRFYEMNDLEQKKLFIDRYNIGWIVVGDQEREKYLVNYKQLDTLGERVVSFGNSYLLKVK